MKTIIDQDSGDTAREPTVAIIAEITACLTYASFQNAVPVVRSIKIENATDAHLEGCTLELVSSPPFIRPKTWKLDRLIPGDTLALTDRKVDLDASYLAGLNEAERGEIRLTLSNAGGLIVEQRLPVRLLARDEWGGVGDMAQLLPAFVMPNDPAIAPILRAAAEALAAHGHPSAMDGYQSQSPQRAFMLAAAIYSAVTGLGLHYAQPPASFENRGQKVRRPGTVVSEGLATCLDTSLMFAAALEAAGLSPVVLLFEGHAAVGVWFQKKTLPQAVEPDATEIRKAVALRELLIFETTGVTHRPAMTLAHAQQDVKRRFEEAETPLFVAAIDITRSRSGGIVPLASHAAPSALPEPDVETPVALPLPPAPDFSDLPADLVDVKPTSAAGRIDRWQKKLLDLTLRNRLLNFADTKKTVPFLCKDPAFLEDRLADGDAIRLISLPGQNPIGDRDPGLYRDVRGQDIHAQFAQEALKRGELSSTLDTKQLEARLIELYRQVRNDFAEGGANTLYLALGFLRWKKKPEDEKSYRAPLLLLPVKLERRSASSQFTLRFHEDEPRFNATLLQFLERDFDLHMPQFAGPLPLDGNGVDVPRLLEQVRQAVRDVPGMEVIDDSALSTFSFAKFLMWKDLVERTDALRRNRMVKHLIDNPEQAFDDGGGAFMDEREIDRQYNPADIVSLLPADSSQLAASMAAAQGRDFVIVGPPGTGKSQTIANMIANCLAAGKTVLFVAEKTAALDVVHRRLREHGLGTQCLELHSSKADRRTFLAQLRKSWESVTRGSNDEWIAVNEKLRIRRDQLNAYVEALHHPGPDGMTAYAALGVALKGKNRHTPELGWPVERKFDAAARRDLEDQAENLGLVFRSIETRPSFQFIDVEDWSSSWQQKLLTASHDLCKAAGAMAAPLNAFTAGIGLAPQSDASGAELDRLASFASVLQKASDHDIEVAFDAAYSKMRPALDELCKALETYENAESGLSGRITRQDLARVAVDDLDRQWREACASFWPLSWLGCRRVRRMLQSYCKTGMAAPQTDLPLLRQMQEAQRLVHENTLASTPLAFAGQDTDVGALDRTLTMADLLRDAVTRLNRSAPETRAVITAISPAKDDTGLAAGFRAAASAYHEAHGKLQTAADVYDEIARADPFDADSDGVLAATTSAMAEIAASSHLLRDWATWCAAKAKAAAHGLSPLVDALERQEIEPSQARELFQIAYARWWLPPALDADPTLRGFRRFAHENAIEEFRQIDDLVRAAASARVISAIAHGLPAAQSVPRNSELGLLRHQMELQRPSRAIREVIAAMPASFSKLAPCMLMSPLSIAQYLPPDQALFDVVIFDEASQITTWDAVGAIARARQTIIVGDPKQLPPTNFFGRNESEEEVAEFERDLESILDEAKAAGIPTRDLRWHYRSRNEGLIAFSNHHYYGNRLITFPSPAVEDHSVRLVKVPDGVYDRGKSRTNKVEARALVADAVGRMRDWLNLPEPSRPTLGIITFNAQQQALIQDLLDEARRSEPALEWFFAEDRYEATIVKNLENVQGDERDVILFSITFTKDAAGKRTMDFGALNREGGERRLNVAVTRARQELVVFSGFTADLVDTSRTGATGVHHLKTFLDFAERGAIALPARDEGSVGPLESPFEEAVAAELVKRGWQIVPQVGISGFRIDIGIRHPDRAGAYLAGVECDGATYHQSATARDRDKVREQVLRGLGWNIRRVWSTDWWFDMPGAVERLHNALEELLTQSRSAQGAAPGAEETTVRWDMGHEIEPIIADGDEVS